MGERLPRMYQPRTLPALLAARASEAPGRTAVVGLLQGVEIGLSYADLLGASRSVAAKLAQAGVESGARVAWMVDNRDGLGAIELFHGVLAAGAVNVPVNPRLTSHEVGNLFADANVSALVYAESAATLAESLPELPARLELEELLKGDETAESQPAEAAEDTPASILYTSGTTGCPKGVVHTHVTSIAAGIAWADAFRLLPSDVYHSPFPVFSGAGLHFMGLAALWAGATYVVDTPDVPETLERIERLRSTVYAAVPSIYQYWLQEPALHERDLSSLRLLDYGGATMPLPVIVSLREAMPAVRLMQTYGLTEAGPGGLYLPEEYAVAKLGAIGSRGAGGAVFRVVSSDTGEEVGADELGELELRAPSVMVGYHENLADTEAAFSADGWLKTGDIVRVDAQGFVFHVDRKNDIIVRGGFNIGSAEVESALLEHPAVVDAAAVGLRHATLGEQVGAVVVLTEPGAASAVTLQAHCAERLADFKVPVSVAFVDELPRNAAGKILKHQLRDDGSIWGA